MSEAKNSEESAVNRVVNLPLVSSALQMVAGVYMEVKRQYPLLGIVGGITELSVRSVSTAASKRATPLLQRLETEIETVNGYALVGLEQLEKSFPVLHQSADEVIENLKETFFTRLGDVQSRVNEEMDGMAERLERTLRFSWDMLEAAQDSAAGKAITSGLDDLLTRSEEAVDYYLPLPLPLQREWEIRVQTYEDEDQVDDDDEDAEPRMWTRVRSLLLCLYLQMYHRFQQLRERAESVLEFLGEAADVMGLTGLLETVWSLLQLLLVFYTAQVQRVEALRSLLQAQFSAGVQALKELPVFQQLLTVPVQVRTVMDDLLDLGQILIQLLINTTPLYDLVQQSSDQNTTDFELPDGASRRSSANNLFLKAMDGRPRRRRSLYARYRRNSSSGSALNPSPALSPSPTPAPAPATSSSPAPTPALSSSPAPTPAPVPALDLARAPSPHSASKTADPESPQDPILQLDTDPAEAQDKLSDQDPTEDQDEVQDSEPTMAQDEIPDLEINKSQDELSSPEPAEVQDEIPDLEINKSQDELSSPEPAKDQDEIQDPDQTEAPPKTPDGRKDSLKKDGQARGSLELDSPAFSSPITIRRRSSAKEVLFSPIMQFVSQSQRAFEYLSTASYSEDQISQMVENNEQ